MIQTLKRLMTVREVHAHCDIPCGIYDPIAAKIAAQTVLKMVVRIEALDDGDMSNEAGNSFFRYVAVKEEHAELCKREINILSNDYFKPEHHEAHADLAFEAIGNADQARVRQQAGRRQRGCREPRGRRRRDSHDLLGHQGRRVQRPRRGGAFRHLAFRQQVCGLSTDTVPARPLGLRCRPVNIA